MNDFDDIINNPDWSIDVPVRGEVPTTDTLPPPPPKENNDKNE